MSYSAILSQHTVLVTNEELQRQINPPSAQMVVSPLFILTLGVGRVSVEGEKVLVGVENFFSHFACYCERKKELRKQSGQPNFQGRSYAPLFHSSTHNFTIQTMSLGQGVPRGSLLFHQHFPHASSSSFTALPQVYLSKRYNRMKGAGAAWQSKDIGLLTPQASVDPRSA